MRIGQIASFCLQYCEQLPALRRASGCLRLA